MSKSSEIDETLTAAEERELRTRAAAAGLKFEEVRAHFVSLRAEWGEEMRMTADEEDTVRQMAERNGISVEAIRAQYFLTKQERGRQYRAERLVEMTADVLTAEEEALCVRMSAANGLPLPECRANMREIKASRASATVRARETQKTAASDTLTASEEQELRAQAERNGLKFEEVRSNFLEIRRNRLN